MFLSVSVRQRTDGHDGFYQIKSVRELQEHVSINLPDFHLDLVLRDLSEYLALIIALEQV
jgi:hypothetical protein